MRYLVLLRGINVGGKNKVSMKIFKENIEKLGFENVVSYLNSGNIIFDSVDEESDIIKKIEKMLLDCFNLSIGLVLIKKEKMKRILENAPEWWLEDSNAKYNVIFVDKLVSTEEIVKDIEKNIPQNEKIYVYDNAIFWSMPAETKSNQRLSQIVSNKYCKNITVRNSNTIDNINHLMNQ